MTGLAWQRGKVRSLMSRISKIIMPGPRTAAVLATLAVAGAGLGRAGGTASNTAGTAIKVGQQPLDVAIKP